MCSTPQIRVSGSVTTPATTDTSRPPGAPAAATRSPGRTPITSASRSGVPPAPSARSSATSSSSSICTIAAGTIRAPTCASAISAQTTWAFVRSSSGVMKNAAPWHGPEVSTTVDCRPTVTSSPSVSVRSRGLTGRSGRAIAITASSRPSPIVSVRIERPVRYATSCESDQCPPACTGPTAGRRAACGIDAASVQGGAGVVEDLREHLGREPAGEGVLLAGVKGAEDQRPALRRLDARPVAERRARPQPLAAAR